MQRGRGNVGGREGEFIFIFFIFRIGRWKVYIFNYLKLERRKRKNWNQFG